MTQRITKDMLEHYLSVLNGNLKEISKNPNELVQYKVQHCNSGYTIEYHKGDICVDSVNSGLSTRQCFDIIKGMQHAIYCGAIR